MKSPPWVFQAMSGNDRWTHVALPLSGVVPLPPPAVRETAAPSLQLDMTRWSDDSSAPPLARSTVSTNRTLAIVAPAAIADDTSNRKRARLASLPLVDPKKSDPPAPFAASNEPRS